MLKFRNRALQRTLIAKANMIGDGLLVSSD
jgi:hypothetical protein